MAIIMVTPLNTHHTIRPGTRVAVAQRGNPSHGNLSKMDIAPPESINRAAGEKQREATPTKIGSHDDVENVSWDFPAGRPCGSDRPNALGSGANSARPSPGWTIPPWSRHAGFRGHLFAPSIINGAPQAITPARAASYVAEAGLRHLQWRGAHPS